MSKYNIEVDELLEKTDTTQRMMIMVRGTCAGEVALNDRYKNVIDVVPLIL